jgi:hypothetical protein
MSIHVYVPVGIDHLREKKYSDIHVTIFILPSLSSPKETFLHIYHDIRSYLYISKRKKLHLFNKMEETYLIHIKLEKLQ